MSHKPLDLTKDFKTGKSLESPIKARLEQQASTPRPSPTKDQIEKKLEIAAEKRQQLLSAEVERLKRENAHVEKVLLQHPAGKRKENMPPDMPKPFLDLSKDFKSPKKSFESPIKARLELREREARASPSKRDIELKLESAEKKKENKLKKEVEKLHQHNAHVDEVLRAHPRDQRVGPIPQAE